MDVKELVFLGGAMAAYEIMELVDDINAINPTYKVVAVLDDDVALHGKTIMGIPVAGCLNRFIEYPNAMFVFAIGSLRTRTIRMDIIRNLGIPRERYVTLIHPNAKVYANAKIGFGCIIHFGAVISVNAVLEDFVIVFYNSTIGVLAKLNEGAMITPLVVILTNVTVGASAFVGANSTVAPNVNIGDGAVIGMATAVFRNVDKGYFVLGNPPKKLGLAKDILC